MNKIQKYYEKIKEYVIIMFSIELFIGIYMTCLSSGLLKKYKTQRSLNIERYNLYARRWSKIQRDTFKPFHFRYFFDDEGNGSFPLWHFNKTGNNDPYRDIQYPFDPVILPTEPFYYKSEYKNIYNYSSLNFRLKQCFNIDCSNSSRLYIDKFDIHKVLYESPNNTKLNENELKERCIKENGKWFNENVTCINDLYLSNICYRVIIKSRFYANPDTYRSRPKNHAYHDKMGCYFNDGTFSPSTYTYNNNNNNTITLEVRHYDDPRIVCEDISEGCTSKTIDNGNCFGNMDKIPKFIYLLIFSIIIDVLVLLHILYYIFDQKRRKLKLIPIPTSPEMFIEDDE